MLEEVQKLLVLQDRDRKLRTLKRELDAMPGERRDLEEKLAGAAARLNEAKQRGKEIEVERKKLEVEAQAKRDSIARFKTQQFQTRKNEEFQALSNEIERYEKDIEAIEDRELDLMQEAEELKPKIAEADREAARSKEQINSQLSDIDAKTKAIEDQIATLSADREQLTEGLDEDLVDRYQRLFSNKGEAVVALEHEVCMGCHMKITTQTAVRVKGGKELVTCDQCGRILYFGD